MPIPDQSLDPAPTDPRLDELIVVRCQLGERAAFDALIERWNEPLWTYVRGMTQQDDLAREILQESWLRVLRGIHRLAERSKFRAWLFGIARRVLADHWRGKYAGAGHAGADAIESIVDPSMDRELDAKDEDLANLGNELARLPDTEREVLTLYYLRELSLADVAQVLAIPAGTVKSRLFRARQMLRAQLEPKG